MFLAKYALTSFETWGNMFSAPKDMLVLCTESYAC